MLETLHKRIGFREIEMDLTGPDYHVLLNGVPVKISGTCRHEASALRGRSVTKEMSWEDARLLKEANINGVRTSHYPPREDFIDACDELGILVIEEAPVNFYYHNNSSTAAEIALQEEQIYYSTARMIQRDRSHPSVFMWDLCNETHWEDSFSYQMVDNARAMDPTRPLYLMWYPYDIQENLSPGDSGYLDVAGFHYPNASVLQSQPGKDGRPMLFSEFAHLQCYNMAEWFTDPSVKDDWGEFELFPLWEAAHDSPSALGTTIWNGFNDEFHVPQAVNDSSEEPRLGGWHWGFIDGFRRQRPEYWHVKKVYSPVRISATLLELPAAGNTLEFEIENRYQFTNLNEIEIHWTVGDESGVIQPDIAAATTGIASITPSAALASGQNLELSVVDLYDREIDRYSIPVGAKQVAILPGSRLNETWSLSQDSAQITISGNRSEWVFDKNLGQLSSMQVDSKDVIVGGPYLAVVMTQTTQEQSADKQPYRNTGVIDTLQDNDLAKNWALGSITASSSGGEVEVVIDGTYDEGTVEFVLLYAADGSIDVSYTFTSAFNAPALVPNKNGGLKEDTTDSLWVRQLGPTFEMASDFQTLHWVRDALWSAYPDNHIGRPVGTTTAFRYDGQPGMAFGEEPSWDWPLDSNDLGTNDFRSTKRDVYASMLSGSDGVGLRLTSDGDSQHTRSYVNGGVTRFILSSLNAGGNGQFNKGILNLTDLRNDNKFVVGTVREDTFRLELVDGVDSGEIPTNEAPSVAITSPSSGATYDEPASFNVDVSASDTDGSITKVELRLNGSLEATDYEAPYGFSVSDLSEGSYTVQVRAYDNQGASASETISIVVEGVELSELMTEAETRNAHSGVGVIDGGTGQVINNIRNGAWVRYDDVDFGSGVSRFELSAASKFEDAQVELRLDALDGTLLGTVNVVSTGNWNTFETFGTDISTQVSDVHDLYLIFRGVDGSSLIDVDWWKLYMIQQAMYTGNHVPGTTPSIEINEGIFSIVFARDLSADELRTPQVTFDLSMPWLSGETYIEEYDLGSAGGFQFFRADSLTPVEDEPKQFMRVQTLSDVE